MAPWPQGPHLQICRSRGPGPLRLKIWARRCEAFALGFGVGENQCTLQIFGGSIRPLSIGSSMGERPKQAGWEFRVVGFRIQGLGFFWGF